jgi:hypothetical protein
MEIKTIKKREIMEQEFDLEIEEERNNRKEELIDLIFIRKSLPLAQLDLLL